MAPNHKHFLSAAADGEVIVYTAVDLREEARYPL
jgi:hypothetical protein